MSCQQTLLSCFPCADKAGRNVDEAILTEKFGSRVVHAQPTCEDPPRYSDDPVQQFIDILTSADQPGKDLERQLKSIVTVNGWTEHLAESILRGVEKVIKKGSKVAKAMGDAIDKAEDTAWEFAKEHPGYAALIAAGTVVALGVMVMLCPWVLEALGFDELGPRAGSFAAKWMSNIARSAGNVEKGSVYSYLQCLGMTWGKQGIGSTP